MAQVGGYFVTNSIAETAADTKVLKQYVGREFTAYNGDNVEVIKGIPDCSIDLSVTSIPFAGMYVYNSTPRDIGNNTGAPELLEHMRFLIRDMLRVTKQGRSFCVHLTNTPNFKSQGGDGGRSDFRGDVIRLFRSEGWIYASEVICDRCPQVRAQRTKDRGLLFKSLAGDSSVMSPVMLDYILIFRKPGENPEPIRAGISKKYGNGQGWITQDEWIEWAHGVWYHKRPGMKGGYSETRMLNGSSAREAVDERHICPLALDLIERCVKLWSAPGDTILDPFGGIGSTSYVAIENYRKGIHIELKESYYDQSIKYCQDAESRRVGHNTMLDLFGDASSDAFGNAVASDEESEAAILAPSLTYRDRLTPDTIEIDDTEI
jgi:DNA modification methylase